MLTLLSSRGLEHEAQEEVMPLSQYKFDRSQIVVVKRTLKHKRALIGGIEKDLTESFEESALWGMSSPNVPQVSVETSIVIVEISLVGQSSFEDMAKEIAWFKQSATQCQNELDENMNNVTKDKQKILDELRIALGARHEQEKQQLT